MHYVYIIETADGTYYTGMTNNLARRLSEHVSGNGRAAAYLRAHRPVYVVYLAECETRGDAVRLENKIKRNPKYKHECIGTRRDIREVIESEMSYR
ncbi:MAG: GIY-YIG nuclease family protein [Candidatus Thorarchaeota archaeon]|nr:MAG: GIY-YIG nuclease family protein [Candidatus Thorarchaeota archaeon]RLI55553.1 MAG: GIY-YIG nuclease family protein [Candidatus Thorarchaeota archaeon]